MEIRAIDSKQDLKGDVKEVQEKLDELIEKNKKEAKENPEYQAMMAKYKKSLAKINKDASTCPWEWSFGLDYFVEFLRFMQEYYKLGINVWAMERKDKDPKRYKNVPTRYESISKALEYYDKWQGLEDEYITVVDHHETYKSHPNDDGTVTIDDLGYDVIYKYGNAKKTYQKLHKEEERYKKLFVNYVAKHIHEWWD